MDFNRAPSVNDDFDALLAASSLGAPRVRAVRAHTPAAIRDLLGTRLEKITPRPAPQPLPATDIVGAGRCRVSERATADPRTAVVSIGMAGAMRAGKATFVNRLLSGGRALAGCTDDLVREVCPHRAPDAWPERLEPCGHLSSGPAISVEAPASAVAGWLFPRARHELVVIPAGWRTLTGIWRRAACIAPLELSHVAPEVVLWDMPGMGESLGEIEAWTSRTTVPQPSLSACSPQAEPIERTVRLSARWHPLPFPDLYGGLDPWLQPPSGRRQPCRWCARAHVPGLGLGDLGVPSYLDLLFGWTMLEGVPTGRLHHRLFHAHRDFGRPVAVQSGLCPAWRLPVPPQTTVLGSGVLPGPGGPRRTLLVVAQGTHALWHLLQGRDLAQRPPELAPATGLDVGLPADEQRAPLACTMETERGVTTVRATAQLQLLVDGPPRPRLVPASFTYRSDDPYAVRVVFGERPGAQVEWVFARELLIEGQRDSSGTGDVRVHRQAATPGQAGPARVHISLSSPEGRAMLAMRSSDLETFLAKTRAVVVYGSEHRHMRVPWETLTEELWWHPDPHR
ncbi:SsgA family sporulation/cell division regulator [Streptomyces sp. NPDC019890]|uniref:SsgA family sporulation/cell division regulator n=1 Tax=Streptomyces sp. NPDC019890 TaxID=3365064 RepID=UPI00384EBD7E